MSKNLIQQCIICGKDVNTKDAILLYCKECFPKYVSALCDLYNGQYTREYLENDLLRLNKLNKERNKDQEHLDEIKRRLDIERDLPEE